MSILRFIDKQLTAILRLLMGISTALLFVVTFAAVVFRYFLVKPLPWSQDVIRLSFTYLIYLGAAYCVKEKAHLNIDVLLSVLKKPLRKIVDLLINLVLLAFFIFLIYFGVKFAATGSRQTSSYLMLPMSYYYAGIPVSGALMAFFILEQLIEQTVALFDKEEKRSC